MGWQTVFLVIMLCSHLLFVGRVQCTQGLSRDKEHDMKINSKLLNKSSVKMVQDIYGDVHDCVDVYKQLGFGHPLLKNHTIDYVIISNPSHYQEGEKNSSKVNRLFNIYLKSQKCPVGTIPIRRISIAYLAGKRQMVEDTETVNRPNTYLAIARTKAGQVGGVIRTDNPKVSGQQFSTTRIKLQAGSDSIEAGWRVDPSLYGDSQTRLFVRTDAGQIHCFNIRCPGFIQTTHHFPLDSPFIRISKPGGPVYDMQFYITRDNKTGNWNFIVGKDNILVGYWPSHIFTGLRSLADHVEWGGAAYSPPGTPLPPMGPGTFPIGDPWWDGCIVNITVWNERGQTVEASNIETYADNSKLYSVRDGGYHGKYWGHVILYGGPGK